MRESSGLGDLPIMSGFGGPPFESAVAPWARFDSMPYPDPNARSSPTRPRWPQYEHEASNTSKSQSDEGVIGYVLADEKYKSSDPGCKGARFTWLGDFRRHFDQQHARRAKQCFCNYDGSNRSKGNRGFGTRKDKRDEHERNVHVDAPEWEEQAAEEKKRAAPTPYRSRGQQLSSDSLLRTDPPGVIQLSLSPVDRNVDECCNPKMPEFSDTSTICSNRSEIPSTEGTGNFKSQKELILDRLMVLFHEIFVSSHVSPRQHNGSSASPRDRSIQAGAQGSSNDARSKRKFQDHKETDGNNDEDDAPERSSKRPRRHHNATDNTLLDSDKQSFACPYFKHNLRNTATTAPARDHKGGRTFLG